MVLLAHGFKAHGISTLYWHMVLSPWFWSTLFLKSSRVSFHTLTSDFGKILGRVKTVPFGQFFYALVLRFSPSSDHVLKPRSILELPLDVSSMFQKENWDLDVVRIVNPSNPFNRASCGANLNKRRV